MVTIQMLVVKAAHPAGPVKRDKQDSAHKRSHLGDRFNVPDARGQNRGIMGRMLTPKIPFIRGIRVCVPHDGRGDFPFILTPFADLLHCFDFLKILINDKVTQEVSGEDGIQSGIRTHL